MIGASEPNLYGLPEDGHRKELKALGVADLLMSESALRHFQRDPHGAVKAATANVSAIYRVLRGIDNGVKFYSGDHWRNLRPKLATGYAAEQDLLASMRQALPRANAARSERMTSALDRRKRADESLV
jgi:hypothetical protein